MKILLIISVGFDITVQLLIIKDGSTMGQYISYSFIDLKKPYDSVRREVLYNILIEFGVPMKAFRLIKCLNETCSMVLIGKHLSDNFIIQQRDALSLLLFNCALEYTIRKVHENQVRLKLNWTHQLLIYTDDLNLLGNNTDTINKNTETLIKSSREVGLEVNARKSKYKLWSRQHSTG
jgi:hypothetical protein